MNLKFSTRGVEEVKKFLASLPRGVKHVATVAIAKYIVGNDQRGLKHYPARVEHGKDNPYKWQSEKQRRAYFATNGFGGGIPYKRTDKLKNAWTYTTQDSNWTMVKIENKSGYAPFVQGNLPYIQRGHLADGWRKYADIVTSNLKGALLSASQAVAVYLKSK